ncbi:MAG: DUF2156 domain-containing protein [bacterium]|nr:DUF2156 domain-containing protein [bacterium]
MLASYPDSTPVILELRPLLHPLFQQVQSGISEHTFANIYLFRNTHNYRLTRLADATIAILGRNQEQSFFMLPFGLPETVLLEQLFHDQSMMKCVSASQKTILEEQGYSVREDRDNFDYLYLRHDLAELAGRQFHKKRNLVKAFVSSHDYTAQPLTEEYVPQAIAVLDAWQGKQARGADYLAAKEALLRMEELQLCGGLYFVEKDPVAYVLGEELGGGGSFAIHFEKAAPGYKGLYQFINQSFASVLPESYATINREQDLGIEGLRKAKLSYNPTGFVEKYRAYAKESE